MRYVRGAYICVYTRIWEALLAHAGGALYGMELGSVTSNRIGFFCFPNKHSTHTLRFVTLKSQLSWVLVLLCTIRISIWYGHSFILTFTQPSWHPLSEGWGKEKIVFFVFPTPGRGSSHKSSQGEKKFRNGKRGGGVGGRWGGGFRWAS